MSHSVDGMVVARTPLESVMWKAISIITLAGVLAFDSATTPVSLGTARIPQAVLADGKPLAAGVYEVRLVDEAAPAPSENERWVEFFAGGRIAGRELASVIPDSEISQIAECPPPKPDTVRVDILKGGEYIRVWANRAGVHYIINLVVGDDEVWPHNA
jgi:hypothetical protein